jgi:hypothetical protein
MRASAGRLHRLDLRELVLRLVEVARLEHVGALGCFVSIIRKQIPAREDEIIQARERHELVDLRHAVLGALAEADRAHLRERADRYGLASAREQTTCDERRRDGTEARQENSQLAVGRGHMFRYFHMGVWLPAPRASCNAPNPDTPGALRAAPERTERATSRPRHVCSSKLICRAFVTPRSVTRDTPAPTCRPGAGHSIVTNAGNL